jgi:hypothetical protein
VCGVRRGVPFLLIAPDCPVPLRPCLPPPTWWRAWLCDSYDSFCIVWWFLSTPSSVVAGVVWPSVVCVVDPDRVSTA